MDLGVGQKIITYDEVYSISEYELIFTNVHSFIFPQKILYKGEKRVGEANHL